MCNCYDGRDSNIHNQSRQQAWLYFHNKSPSENIDISPMSIQAIAGVRSEEFTCQRSSSTLPHLGDASFCLVVMREIFLLGDIFISLLSDITQIAISCQER